MFRQGPDMKKILVVEDHADIRKLVRLTLELGNYDIHEAASGPQGVEAAADCIPDVVLLDVMMPGEYDGLEACRRIKANPALSHAKVLMLTARGQSSDQEAGLNAGADAYLAKPFSPLQLIETIEQHLRATA
mgnify:CR=1 FL=1